LTTIKNKSTNEEDAFALPLSSFVHQRGDVAVCVGERKSIWFLQRGILTACSRRTFLHRVDTDWLLTCILCI
jgi:hypothetical protein